MPDTAKGWYDFFPKYYKGERIEAGKEIKGRAKHSKYAYVWLSLREQVMRLSRLLGWTGYEAER